MYSIRLGRNVKRLSQLDGAETDVFFTKALLVLGSYESVMNEAPPGVLFRTYADYVAAFNAFCDEHNISFMYGGNGYTSLCSRFIYWQREKVMETEHGTG